MSLTPAPYSHPVTVSSELNEPTTRLRCSRTCANRKAGVRRQNHRRLDDGVVSGDLKGPHSEVTGQQWLVGIAAGGIALNVSQKGAPVLAHLPTIKLMIGLCLVILFGLASRVLDALVQDMWVIAYAGFLAYLPGAQQAGSSHGPRELPDDASAGSIVQWLEEDMGYDYSHLIVLDHRPGTAATRFALAERLSHVTAFE
jgi:hypothetical protein